MFLQPINLRWRKPRADFMIAYGLYLPTGRYQDGADNNTGLGMWAQEVLLGTTVFLNQTKSCTRRRRRRSTSNRRRRTAARRSATSSTSKAVSARTSSAAA